MSDQKQSFESAMNVISARTEDVVSSVVLQVCLGPLPTRTRIDSVDIQVFLMHTTARNARDWRKTGMGVPRLST